VFSELLRSLIRQHTKLVPGFSGVLGPHVIYPVDETLPKLLQFRHTRFVAVRVAAGDDRLLEPLHGEAVLRVVAEERRHIGEDRARPGLVWALTLELLDVAQELLEILPQLLWLEGLGAGRLVNGDDRLRNGGGGGCFALGEDAKECCMLLHHIAVVLGLRLEAREGFGCKGGSRGHL
jgi:hypothetical protein